MNPNAQKWVDALRSGEYAQAVGQLKSFDGRYCCHGVACTLLADQVQGEWDDTLFVVNDELQNYRSMPPQTVREALDIDSGFADHLAVANDNGKSFSEIADMIEDYFA